MLGKEGYWRPGFSGWVVKVASAGTPGEGRGTVILQVEVPRPGLFPWAGGSDSKIVEVPAEQVDAALAFYPPGDKALRDVAYRRVDVEYGLEFYRKAPKQSWLRRLLRQPLELRGDVVKSVVLGELREELLPDEA